MSCGPSFICCRSAIDTASVEAQQKQKAAERGRLALRTLRQGRRLRELSTELQCTEQANMGFKAQHTPAAQPKESSLTVRCKPGDSQNKLTTLGQYTLLPHQAPLEVIAQTQWKLKSGPPCLAGGPRAHARGPLHCSMAASPGDRPGLATQGHCIARAYTPKPAPTPVQSEACQSPKRASRSSAAFRAPRSGLPARSTSPLGSSAASKQPFKTASSTRQMTNSQPAAPIKGAQPSTRLPALCAAQPERAVPPSLAKNHISVINSPAKHKAADSNTVTATSACQKALRWVGQDRSQVVT